MHARMKRFYGSRRVDWVSFPDENGKFVGVVVACEVTHPPSSAGRTVHLMLDVEDVTDLLLVLRGRARAARGL